MKCPMCGEETVRGLSDYPVTVAGRMFTVELRGEVCPCGEVYFAGKDLKKAELTAALELIETGNVGKAEFRLFRKLLSLSSKRTAELFGAAPETVSRWEKGERDVPLLAAATISMMLVEHATAATNYESVLDSLGSPREPRTVLKSLDDAVVTIPMTVIREQLAKR